jgi:hypothetical protein
VPDETSTSTPSGAAAETLAAAMRSLYAVTPEEFMAERKRVVAEAKSAGHVDEATELGRMRKPSTAAWALNLLAREAPDVVERLADLGGRMRAAQGRMDTATLTSLRPERDAVVDEFGRTAARLVGEVGRTVSPAAQQDIRATAIAALADEQAMAAVASGQLTRTLSYSGFGEVDLAEAVVRTTSGAILSVVRGGRRSAGGAGRDDADERGDDANEEADGADDAAGTEEPDLEQELATAQAELAAAEAEVGRARERAEETRERLAVVERQLAKARAADERALEAVTDAVRARKQAEAARHTAQEALDASRRGD